MIGAKVRPVRCWYCGQQMHYSGHVEHVPEVQLTLDTGDTDKSLFYLHTRCWNNWQQRRRGYAAAAVAAERKRLERDVASLHMSQSINNQNYPSAWHDGVDAALEVIRGA